MAPDDGTEVRKTHIEVCVRLRPLKVSHESSSSFFKKEQKQRPPESPLHSRSPRRKSQIPTRAARTPPRPEPPVLSSLQQDVSNETYAWNVTGGDVISQSPKTDIVPGRTHIYTLDHVYGPETTTKQLYHKSCLDLVHAAMDGYHTSILAYGQTSTGKTHTMAGTSKQPGVVPLCVNECFKYLQNSTHPREYLLRVSYMEVYKEHIRDLLNSSPAAPPVRLFDSPKDGLVIKGIKEEVVTCPNEVFKILAGGEARRQVGATSFNAHSSRSHVIVRLWIESSSSSDGNRRGTRISSLSLVDLAGSESVRLTGSLDRQKEGQYINKSLMTLGQIVYALSDIKKNKGGTKKHIPYRDSKLTRLLQPSLSGNAQVVLLCCVSPMVNHLEESHNTLKFAIRAKKIEQKATIQESGVDEKTLLQSYREEINDLKQQLKEAREQQTRLAKESKNQSGNQPDIMDKISHFESLSSGSYANEITAEEEVQELVEAITTMEGLILKTSSPIRQPEELIDFSDLNADDNAEESLLALSNDKNMVTPRNKNHHSTPLPKSHGPAAADEIKVFDPHVPEQMRAELTRIRGLLGSVLKKRMTSNVSTENEVRNLRSELEAHEVTSALRSADSSFLQKQLEEKDILLQEVSKILEAVEERQTELEKENAALHLELKRLKRQVR